MRRFITSLGQDLFAYRYMMLLRKIFSSPRDLLYSPSLSLRRKKHLLKKWRDERTLYICENCRDLDYLQDREMEDLLRTVKIVKAVMAAEKDNDISISISRIDQTKDSSLLKD